MFTGILSDLYANMSVRGGTARLCVREHCGEWVACRIGRCVREKTRERKCSAMSRSTKTLPERKGALSASLPMCCLVEEDERGRQWA